MLFFTIRWIYNFIFNNIFLNISNYFFQCKPKQHSHLGFTLSDSSIIHDNTINNLHFNNLNNNNNNNLNNELLPTNFSYFATDHEDIVIDIGFNVLFIYQICLILLSIFLILLLNIRQMERFKHRQVFHIKKEFLRLS